MGWWLALLTVCVRLLVSTRSLVTAAPVKRHCCHVVQRLLLRMGGVCWRTACWETSASPWSVLLVPLWSSLTQGHSWFTYSVNQICSCNSAILFSGYIIYDCFLFCFPLKLSLSPFLFYHDKLVPLLMLCRPWFMYKKKHKWQVSLRTDSTVKQARLSQCSEIASDM